MLVSPNYLGFRSVIYILPETKTANSADETKPDRTILFNVTKNLKLPPCYPASTRVLLRTLPLYIYFTILIPDRA